MNYNPDFKYERKSTPEELKESIQTGYSQKQSLILGQADATKLPFENHSFDVVLMNSVLY